MYERLRVNVKFNQEENLTFKHDSSYLGSISFMHLNVTLVYTLKLRDGGSPP